MILQNRKQTNSSIAWSIILINKIVDLINLDGPIYQPCSAEWPQTSPANCCVRSRSQLAEENMFESHSNIQSGILSLGEREHVFFTLLKGIVRTVNLEKDKSCKRGSCYMLHNASQLMPYRNISPTVPDPLNFHEKLKFSWF